MIIHKRWIECTKGGRLEWGREGWYLFGIVPLYIQDLAPRGRQHS